MCVALMANGDWRGHSASGSGSMKHEKAAASNWHLTEEAGWLKAEEKVASGK